MSSKKTNFVRIAKRTTAPLYLTSDETVSVPPPKMLLLNLMALLCIFILFYCPCAAPLTFNFTTFINDVDIVTEGDANVCNPFLHLTRDTIGETREGSVGRATYREPLLLREKTTGQLADFTTNITFIIDSQHSTSYAEGLSFFLAPAMTYLNKSIGCGSSLGLPVNSTPQFNTAPKSQYPFVAVEFDIFSNPLPPVVDPPFEHVGINLNSTNSAIIKRWNGRIANAGQNRVWISYNSSTKNLRVAFTNFVNENQVIGLLSYIVDLVSYLPDSVIVGFSAATGHEIAVHKIVSWNFSSTSLQVSTPPPPSSSPGGQPHSVISIELKSVGLCIAVVGVFGSAWFIWWKSRDRTDKAFVVNDLMNKELQGIGPRTFAYRELARATSNFVEEEKLGEGGFGGVYRGFIKDLNTYVAVKRISKGSQQGLKEYASEVRTISRLRHCNVVQLIGWCHEKRELLLVYEFMPNGSLDFHLFEAKKLLTWEARYKIAQGLASSLLYLHQEGEQCVLHRDIKSSNVMLDSNFTAKLGDFGLARLVDHGKESQTTSLVGTMGYMAPEYVTTGKASKEFDVYSFGVVALEIACGRKPIDSKLESSQMIMVEWVWELYGQGKVLEAADLKLRGEFDEKQMECLLVVGLWCAHLNYDLRPSIQQVIQVLDFKVPLPIVPPNMSMATCYAPPVSLPMFMPGDTSSFESGQT